VHDPQPLPLINYYEKTHPWIWRCHIDASQPNKELWNYLDDFIKKYDHAIFSKKEFMQDLNIPQHIIHPSIDPLSPKNKKLTQNHINKYLKKFDIKTDKPIISQVSRFDKWKDPLGVIKTFKQIKKKVDCRLVLLGSMATDDPEGQKIHEKVLQRAKDIPDIKVICFENNILVNAVQTASDVVIQKSLKEGFGLTVTEALWKKTPVVASNVGGIPLQIKGGKNGFLINSIEECADKVVFLLKNPEKAKKMGEAGHEHVKNNFLITRHLLDYLNLLNRVIIN
jgi:trehalose synthase